MDESIYRNYLKILNDIYFSVHFFHFEESKEVKDMIISLSIFNLIMIDNDILKFDDLFENVESKIKKLILFIKEWLNKYNTINFQNRINRIQKCTNIDRFNLSLVLIGVKEDTEINYIIELIKAKHKIISQFNIIQL